VFSAAWHYPLRPETAHFVFTRCKPQVTVAEKGKAANPHRVTLRTS
jgi:hypothetical protein